MSENLEALGLFKAKCHECGKEVIVTRMSPSKDPEKITGIWLKNLDQDCQEHNVGFLCMDHLDNPKYSFGFCGGMIKNLDLWEAYLEPSIDGKKQTMEGQ
jgi:hypothetical protein